MSVWALPNMSDNLSSPVSPPGDSNSVDVSLHTGEEPIELTSDTCCSSEQVTHISVPAIVPHLVMNRYTTSSQSTHGPLFGAAIEKHRS